MMKYHAHKDVVGQAMYGVGQTGACKGEGVQGV